MAGRLLLLFIVVPLVETWLLIEVGSRIGALATIGLIILTAIIGSQLVRIQGFRTVQEIQAHQQRGEAPALPLLEGAALLIAGITLLTPGFLTDALGFALLVPALRRRLAVNLLRRAVVMTPDGNAGPGPTRRPGDDRTIEGDYRRDE
ncbi:FxsA family protein [Spectribacter hydrogenoxidans]|uniref:FxsA family protein n=1 Tax=Spectribacter hydrogenoxidans TaxID=3075608 RepID=A0ABU3BXV0_9GAMM|nr:FxsA family protein [Salinisphaera sp. W335]MDT0634137.1 FxsA family protein [Salinisphaera sp. W335]